MSLNRRNFLKTIGVAGVTLTVGNKANANSANKDAIEFYGMLIDTTQCVGCRNT